MVLIDFNDFLQMNLNLMRTLVFLQLLSLHKVSLCEGSHDYEFVPLKDAWLI